MSPTNMRSAAPSRQRIRCPMRESHGRNSIPDPATRLSLLNIRFWVRSPKYSLLRSFDSPAHIPNHLLRTPNQKDTRSEAVLWQYTPPPPVESPACIPTPSRTVLLEH